MSRYCLIFCVFFGIISCKDSKSYDNDRAYSFQELATIEQKTEFLQEIFNSDQSVRTDKNKTEIQLGSNSKDASVAAQKMKATDNLNLAKVQWYLDHYEYPNPELFGEKLSITPALVVHHAANLNLRKKLYPNFKAAYDDNYLDANFFSFYLGRIYEMENDEYFRMPSPYQLEDQIDTLIVLLELE